jgi:hypothetical protein
LRRISNSAQWICQKIRMFRLPRLLTQIMFRSDIEYSFLINSHSLLLNVLNNLDLGNTSLAPVTFTCVYFQPNADINFCHWQAVPPSELDCEQEEYRWFFQ